MKNTPAGTYSRGRVLFSHFFSCSRALRAAKAFTEPFQKPKRDGTPGPIVNKVKICEVSTLQAPVLRGDGVEDNDSMVRIHVAVNTRAKIKEQKRERQSNSLHRCQSL